MGSASLRRTFAAVRLEPDLCCGFESPPSTPIIKKAGPKGVKALRAGLAPLRSAEPSLRYGYEPALCCGFESPPSTSIIKKAGPKGAGFFNDGGEGGIRTHGTLASTPHFECGAFDHSATSPSRFPGSAGQPQKRQRPPDPCCSAPQRAPEPSKGGSLRICTDNRKPFSRQARLFSAHSGSALWKTKGNHIEFLSLDWDFGEQI